MKLLFTYNGGSGSVEYNFLGSNAKLFINGTELSPVGKPNSCKWIMPDNSEARLKLGFIALVPNLEINGQKIHILRLSKKEWVLVLAPVIILFGGIIPIFLGLALSFANLQILKSESSKPYKTRVFLSVMVIVATFIVAFIIYSLIGLLKSK